jgi:hypothetical protein
MLQSSSNHDPIWNPSWEILKEMRKNKPLTSETTIAATCIHFSYRLQYFSNVGFNYRMTKAVKTFSTCGLWHNRLDLSLQNLWLLFPTPVSLFHGPTFVDSISTFIIIANPTLLACEEKQEIKPQQIKIKKTKNDSQK